MYQSYTKDKQQAGVELGQGQVKPEVIVKLKLVTTSPVGELVGMVGGLEHNWSLTQLKVQL